MQRESEEFGSYRLIRRLGVGGMAEAFEAARSGPGGFAQHVCLKRVLPAYSDDQRFIERFHREARLAAQLRHSNVVSVIDFGEVEGAPYMALELVDGIDLRSLLASRPDKRLPPDWVVLIGSDLAFALEHAHHPDRAVVHRDISPSNILLGRGGEAKLADFGLAKTMGSEGATASQTLHGKIPYMAPEHMRGESVDGRADLFSLGVVLFEALTGRRPFDGAHDVETMQRVVAGKRCDLASLAPDTPAALRQIIDKLIATERDARFDDASALVEAFSALGPAMRTRAELGRVVEGHRGGPQTRKHVAAHAPQADSETVTVAAPRTRKLAKLEEAPLHPNERHDGRSKRRRGGWLAALAVAALALASGLGSLQGPSSSAPSSAKQTPPGAAEANAAAGGPAAAKPAATLSSESRNQPLVTASPLDPDEGASKRQPRAKPRRSSPAPRTNRGRVRVVVQPWGNVWIDDRFMGRAPFSGPLTKGRHVVAVGQDRPTMSKLIEVSPGKVQQIELNLEP